MSLVEETYVYCCKNDIKTWNLSQHEQKWLKISHLLPQSVVHGRKILPDQI